MAGDLRPHSRMMLTLLWGFLALVVLAAGVRHVLRLRALRQGRAASSSGDDTGEPLDWDEIAAAEERALAEEWDEPEEYER